MGVVYRAFDSVENRPVALKLLGVVPHLAYLADRFEREAQTIARLSHPGIAELYEAGQQGRVCYIAIRCVDGDSLRVAADQVRRQGRPRGSFESASYDRRVAEVLRQLAEVLTYAHSAGVIHRDLKPENVLVDAGGQVHVIDFGLARSFADLTLTATGNLIGTPLYMAPEQLRGDAASTFSDQYAVGVMGYELLCGVPPFGGPTLEAMVRDALRAAPVPARWRAPDASTELCAVIHKAMARNPSDRYANLAALADDLKRVLANGRVSATPYRYTFDDRETAAERPWLVTWLVYVSLIVSGFFLQVGLMAGTNLSALAAAGTFLPGGLFLLTGVGLSVGRWWGVLAAGATVVWCLVWVGMLVAGVHPQTVNTTADTPLAVHVSIGAVFLTLAVGLVWVLTRPYTLDWLRQAIQRRAAFNRVRMRSRQIG